MAKNNKDFYFMDSDICIENKDINSMDSDIIPLDIQEGTEYDIRNASHKLLFKLDSRVGARE